MQQVFALSDAMRLIETTPVAAKEDQRNAHTKKIQDALDKARQLAAEWGYARGAIEEAFAQLQIEGFIDPVLGSIQDENEVWVNADVARRQGWETGTYVRLRNQDGVVSKRVKVRATERIRGDCVYMIHGFGHTAKGLPPAFRKGASDNLLVTRYAVDPLMGGTGMNVNFVTLEAEA